MVKKQFAFEELTYLDTADKELKKMIDLHINKLNVDQIIPPQESPVLVATSPFNAPPIPPTESVTSSPIDTPSYLPPQVPSIPPTVSIYNNKIEMAMALDFASLPRLDRKGECEIKCHKRKQAGDNHRTMTILTAKQWGVDNPLFTKKQRERIRTAACRLVSFDYGFRRPFGHR